MCDCGCGNMSPDEVFKVGKGKYLSVSTYHGCDYCSTGLAFDIHFFNEKGRKDWCDGLKPQALEFDEYGGNGGQGLMLGFVGVEELRKAAKKLDLTLDDYESVDDWLADNGLRLLQEAFRIHLEEIAKNAAKAKKP